MRVKMQHSPSTSACRPRPRVHAAFLHLQCANRPFWPKLWGEWPRPRNLWSGRTRCLKLWRHLLGLRKLWRDRPGPLYRLYTSKTIGRSKSTYICQEVDLENWEDRRGLFEQCRDYYDIAGRARRYTCLLHYCENYEFLCTSRNTKISGLCTFWYINFRVYELFWYMNFGYMHFRVYALPVLCYPTTNLTSDFRNSKWRTKYGGHNILETQRFSWNLVLQGFWGYWLRIDIKFSEFKMADPIWWTWNFGNSMIFA